ncbi:DUF1467 domain-containing protein, partial [Mesorhizobium sp. M8A.F.Ca.ET.182.01.1.1]
MRYKKPIAQEDHMPLLSAFAVYFIVWWT